MSHIETHPAQTGTGDHQHAGRSAGTGELCTCGRQATTVYVHDDGRETGYCGRADGGQQAGPCPFCGAAQRHRTAWGDPATCPQYRLTPTTPDTDQ